MSTTILVLGPTGSGKSTSTKSLDPKTTFFINVLDKPLPFKGFSKKYKEMSSWEDKQGNYLGTDNWQKICKAIEVVNDTRPSIKTLVIDDLQYVLANEFMRTINEKGYEKFSSMANHFWQIINAATKTRKDLTCVFYSHNEVDNFGKSKCKTIGKLLDEKITIEGMFTLVLHTIVDERGYHFMTQADQFHTAKSPDGMFSERLIPNDIDMVIKECIKYFSGE